MLRHATGYKLANDGQGTRAIQHCFHLSRVLSQGGPSAVFRVKAAPGRWPRRAHAQDRMGRSGSLADVALAVSCADQARLSRMFKDAVGVSPARYRGLEATGTR